MPAICSSGLAMTDYHIHPEFSHDAEGSLLDYCRRSVELGIEEICFTTHYEPDPTRFDREFVRVAGRRARPDSDWAVAYFRQIEECRRQFPNLVVLAGVEVGYEMGIDAAIADMLGRYPFDYVLGAVHLIDHVAITSSHELADFRCLLAVRGAEYVARRYFEYVRAVAESGLFDCLAHFDIWRRYVQPEMGAEFERAIAGYVRPMLEVTARLGLGLEVNTGGLRKGGGELYPSRAIIEQAAALGIRVFTTGSDAHRPADTGFGISAAEQILAELGLKPARFRRRELQL